MTLASNQKRDWKWIIEMQAERRIRPIWMCTHTHSHTPLWTSTHSTTADSAASVWFKRACNRVLSNGMMARFRSYPSPGWPPSTHCIPPSCSPASPQSVAVRCVGVVRAQVIPSLCNRRGTAKNCAKLDSALNTSNEPIIGFFSRSPLPTPHYI